MAWEERERGGRYYTRSRRVGGRVVREYVGTGYVAELAARWDEVSREQETMARVERGRRRQEWLAILKGGGGFDPDLRDAADKVVEAIMIAAGYHRHGTIWRLRRRGR